MDLQILTLDNYLCPKVRTNFNQFLYIRFPVVQFVRKDVSSEVVGLGWVRLGWLSDAHAQTVLLMGVADGDITVPPRDFEVPSEWYYAE
jgi:hypothetical protein